MRGKFISLMSTAILALFTSTAVAADIVSPAPSFNWTGFYVGAQGGFDITSDNFNDPNYSAPPPATFGSFSFTGIEGGVHAGYDWQSNAMVYGLVTDIALAGGSGNANDATNFVNGAAFAKWQGSTRLKAGYAMNNALLYVTGGLAYGNFDLNYTFPIPGTTRDQFNTTRLGYTIGAGLEYAVSDHLTTGVEYRYTDYGKASGSIAVCCAPAPNAQDHQLRSHLVQLDLSYHF